MKRSIITLCLLLITVVCAQCKKENPINYPVLEGPEGSTKNLFSVGLSKQVYFSKGNLQYQASTNTWRFAENQWDIIGEANVNVSPSYSGWIDLFLYGSSGFDGIYPYLLELPDDKIDVGGMEISGTEYDWGVYNPISNGGNQAGLWRVLSKEEMVYLLSRQDANGNWLSGKGSLNKKDGSCDNGIFIMPDNYISNYSYPYGWVINENDLCGYGGVFISTLSGGRSFWNNSISWYEDNPLLYVSSVGDCSYENEEDHLKYGCVNDVLRISQGTFWAYVNRHLTASVRLVQDYNE